MKGRNENHAKGLTQSNFISSGSGEKGLRYFVFAQYRRAQTENGELYGEKRSNKG